MKKNSFYVIIESNGEYEHYDILPGLSFEWSKLKLSQKNECLKDLQSWVDKELKYRYWSRCEYEFLVLPWPNCEKDKPKKIDVYWQLSKSIELITRLFKENEKIS